MTLICGWQAPGEADALQKVIDLFKNQYPNTTVTNLVTSGAGSLEVFDAKLSANEPVDAFQLTANKYAKYLPAPDGTGTSEQLSELDAFVANHGGSSTFWDYALNAGTYNGHNYAIPVGIHQDSGTFYNKTLFATNSITVPASFAQLMSACDTLKNAGAACFASGNEGWIMLLSFNMVFLASQGKDAFEKYYSGTCVDETAIGDVVDAFDNLMKNYTKVYIKTGVTDYGAFSDVAGGTDDAWIGAAKLVESGSAAMYTHGDWVLGYYQAATTFDPDADFGIFPPPGTPDYTLYEVDGIAIPANNANPDGAEAFVGVFSSKQGQEEFNNLKGSCPVRSDADLNQLSAAGKAACENLYAATTRVHLSDLGEAILDDYAGCEWAATPQNQGDKAVLLAALLAELRARGIGDCD